MIGSIGWTFTLCREVFFSEPRLERRNIGKKERCSSWTPPSSIPQSLMAWYYGWLLNHEWCMVPWYCYPPGNDHISHLGKRKIIFKSVLVGHMLVPWRVILWWNSKKKHCRLSRNRKTQKHLAFRNISSSHLGGGFKDVPIWRLHVLQFRLGDSTTNYCSQSFGGSICCLLSLFRKKNGKKTIFAAASTPCGPVQQAPRNESTRPRYILVLRFWHPGLTEAWPTLMQF